MPAFAAAQAGMSQGSAERGDNARGRRAGASGPHAPSSLSPTPREREEVAGGRVSRRPPAHRPVLPGTAPALRRRRADARWVDPVLLAAWREARKRGIRSGPWISMSQNRPCHTHLDLVQCVGSCCGDGGTCSGAQGQVSVHTSEGLKAVP